MTAILDYHSALASEDRAVCEMLMNAITCALPHATGKVWHGHPVWFIDGNPVVGYHRQKDSVRVLFWSGQSFDEPSLAPVGKFRAAGFPVTSLSSFDHNVFGRLLAKADAIQWDYQNLPRNRELVKRTAF